MKRLTLGVLTFNDGKYLKELLDSIDKQGNTNFDLLIIINGSTDNSSSIIENFKNLTHDFEIKLVHNPENYGSFSGTKQLFINATTSYLSIIHGDDLLKSNYVEVANKYIDSNPDICAFNFDLNEIEGGENIFTGNVIKSGWTKFSAVNRFLVSGLNPGVMPGAVLNLSKLGRTFLDTEIDDIKLNGTEDILLWQKIIRSSNKIMRVPISPYYYRRHSNQISKNFEVYGLSLGCARRVNFLTARNKFERLLCISEIKYEFSLVNFNKSYLEGLDDIIKYKIFSLFRFINIFIRRFANLINFCS